MEIVEHITAVRATPQMAHRSASTGRCISAALGVATSLARFHRVEPLEALSHGESAPPLSRRTLLCGMAVPDTSQAPEPSTDESLRPQRLGGLPHDARVGTSPTSKRAGRSRHSRSHHD
jgi:hypothetical protein